MSESLLPPNATPLEKAVEQSTKRLAGPDMTEAAEAIGDLWQADRVPRDLLPWLAWTLSVDEWDDAWSDNQKRDTIRESIAVHKQKGTVASVRRVLRAAGYGECDIVEGLDAQHYDGAIKYDGTYYHGQNDEHWAMYRVYVKWPVSAAQASVIRQLLDLTAPARCRLEGLHYGIPHPYDGTIKYDGTFTHGVA